MPQDLEYLFSGKQQSNPTPVAKQTGVKDLEYLFANDITDERRAEMRANANAMTKPTQQSFMRDVVGKTVSDIAEPVIPSANTAINTAQNIGRVYPAAETAAQFATMSYGLPISGLSGLAALPFGLENAGKVQDWVSDKLIYQPQTQHGRELSETVAYPFAQWHEGSQGIGNVVRNATGSPEAAAAAASVVEAAPFIIPGVRNLKQKPQGPRQVKTYGNEAAPLDATLAKDNVLSNIVKNREVGKPLEKLARKEDIVAMDNSVLPVVGEKAKAQAPLEVARSEKKAGIENAFSEEKKAQDPLMQMREEMRTELEREPIKPEDKINGITSSEASKMIIKGDKSVLPHIQEGMEKHGQLAMQDTVRNQVTKDIYRAEDPNAAMQNFKKLEPALDNIIKKGNPLKNKGTLDNIIKRKERDARLAEVGQNDISPLKGDESFSLADEVNKNKPPVPETPAGKKAPKAKEPWEMTRDEYSHGAKVRRDLEKNYVITTAPNGAEIITRTLEPGQPKEKLIKGAHRFEIAEAIKEGKPVPPEVLADYPDLAPKVSKTKTVAEYKKPEYATGNVNTQLNYGNMKDAFRISNESGSEITGYIKNQDFPGEKSKQSRGELFLTSVAENERMKGLGQSLNEDAIRLMWENGTKTVNLHATSPGGRKIVKNLIDKGFISDAINASSSGKTEHIIFPNGETINRGVYNPSDNIAPKPTLDNAVKGVEKGKPVLTRQPVKKSNVRTLRGRIKEMGGINFLNFKGELKDMHVDVKYLSKKSGVPIDKIESSLREEGWLYPNENLLDVLRDNPAVLRRNHISKGDTVVRMPHEKATAAEKKFNEAKAWEQEAPPKGEYVTKKAEDLPEGAELTMVPANGSAWDRYKVVENDPFGITLKDGEVVHLPPDAKVDVLKSDLAGKGKPQSLEGIIKPRTVKDVAADIKTVISPPKEKAPLGNIIKNKKFRTGEKGELNFGSLDKDQRAAYTRLVKDLDVIKRNAKRIGKPISNYLVDLGEDPRVAKAIQNDFAIPKPPIQPTSKRDEKYAGSINVTKQNLPDGAINLERAAAPKKKVQTWDETGKLSEEIRKDAGKTASVLNKAGRGKALTAVEIDAIRQTNVNAVDRLHKMVNEVDPKKFNEEFLKYKNEVANPVSKASSEAGRALNIHKKELSANRLAKAFDELKRGLNEREMKEFRELNMDNPSEVQRFIKRLGNPKLSDYALEYWYNAVLSGPPTHMVNAVSTGLWLAWQLPHRAMSALVDAPFAKLTKRPRERFLNEIGPMLQGYKTGLPGGGKKAWQILRTGKISELDSKWALEMGNAVGAFERSPYKPLRKVAPYITPPTKALRGMDVWLKSMAYDAQVNALARRAANKKGLKGFERQQFEREFINNLSDEAHADAMKFSEYATFMDGPDPFTKHILSARNIPVMGPALRFTVLPFVNTISNLMKRGAEMTPGVGLVKEAVSRGMGRGSHTPDVIAKQIEGAIIAAYIMDKVDAGEITGGLPQSKNERESWYRQGKKPWAIRVGDKWIEYRRVEPFNTVIASVSIAYDKMKNAKDDATREEIAQDIANEIKNNVIDGSYFQGIQSLMNRNQKAKDSAARFAASWIPYSSALRSTSRAVEVYQTGSAKPREGEGFLKAFSTTIPGLSKDMPAKLDVWGNESVIPGGVLRQWLPWKWDIETNDPLEKELARLDIYPGLPGKKYKPRNSKEYKEIPDEIYRKYAIAVGHKLHKRLSKAIKENSYKNAPDEIKMKRLTHILTSTRDGERAKMRNELRKKMGIFK
jgi:hypothetical protein